MTITAEEIKENVVVNKLRNKPTFIKYKEGSDILMFDRFTRTGLMGIRFVCRHGAYLMSYDSTMYVPYKRLKKYNICHISDLSMVFTNLKSVD